MAKIVVVTKEQTLPEVGDRIEIWDSAEDNYVCVEMTDVLEDNKIVLSNHTWISWEEFIAHYEFSRNQWWHNN